MSATPVQTQYLLYAGHHPGIHVGAELVLDEAVVGRLQHKRQVLQGEDTDVVPEEKQFNISGWERMEFVSPASDVKLSSQPRDRCAGGETDDPSGRSGPPLSAPALVAGSYQLLGLIDSDRHQRQKMYSATYSAFDNDN